MFLSLLRHKSRDQRPKEPTGDSGLITSPEMEISIRKPLRSRRPLTRRLEAVFPEFSLTSVEKVIRTVEPEYEPSPTSQLNKRQKICPPAGAHRGDEDDVALSPLSELSPRRTPSTYMSLDDLIKAFPGLNELVEQEKARIDRIRVPIEYILPYKKPSHDEPRPPISSQVISSHGQTTESGTQSMSTSSPADLTSAVATPTEPALGVGGGLLAGIDDLFGQSKRSGIKSKYRR
jgi:hypothetical protein